MKLEVTQGMQTESVPTANKVDQGGAYYKLSTEKEGNSIRMTREWRMYASFVQQQQYLSLRTFYGRVLAGDSQQATLLRQVVNADAKQPGDGPRVRTTKIVLQFSPKYPAQNGSRRGSVD